MLWVTATSLAKVECHMLHNMYMYMECCSTALVSASHTRTATVPAVRAPPTAVRAYAATTNRPEAIPLTAFPY